MAEIEVKNKFSVGDRIELIHPQGNLILEIAAMRNKHGAHIEVAPGNGHFVRIPLPAGYAGAFMARFVTNEEVAESD